MPINLYKLIILFSINNIVFYFCQKSFIAKFFETFSSSCRILNIDNVLRSYSIRSLVYTSLRNKWDTSKIQCS